MTHAERTEILAVVAILEKSKDLLRSRMLGGARERLQALVDGVRPYLPRCPNTSSGTHVRIADLEYALEGEPLHCDGCDVADMDLACHGVEIDEDDQPKLPELIDDTACLACGARL